MMQVTITSPQLVTDQTNPTITVNYGGRVAQLNPLLLYNISGASRTDVVYNVNTGVVTITAYVDDATQNADVWWVLTHFLAALPYVLMYMCFHCCPTCNSTWAVLQYHTHTFCNVDNRAPGFQSSAWVYKQ